MRKEKDFVLEDNIDIYDFACYLSDYLKKDSTMLVATSCSGQQVVLNCKTSSRFKTFFGLSRRFSITLSQEGDRCHIIVDFSYKTQIICFLIGFFLLLIPFPIIILVGLIMIPASIFGTVRLFMYQTTFLHHLGLHISQERITKITDASYAHLWENNTAAEIYKMAVDLDGENKKRSFALYNLAAEKGATEAILKLGLWYYDGERVKQNFQKAYSLWNRRPQELSGEAALKFGDMHRDGNCTEKDLKKALQFYKQAPQEDFEQRIIELYEQGTYLKEYKKAAAQIYEKRFGAGEKQLLDKIIDLYTELKNEKKVQQYKVEKAKCGDAALALNLGKKLYKEGKKEAVPLLEQAASEEDPIALRMLGEAYLKGELVRKNEKKAIEILQHAVQKGSLRASELLQGYYADDKVELVKVLEQKIALEKSERPVDKKSDFILHKDLFRLALIYLDEDKRVKNISRGIELLEQSIEHGNTNAYLMLAAIFTDCPYVKADLDRAISYCKKAVEANVEEAEHLLKDCQIKKAKNGDIELALSLGKKLYEEGQKEAVELLEIAASKNDPAALCMLGEAYLNGNLVRKNGKKAADFLQKAVTKGSFRAAELLVLHHRDDGNKLVEALEQMISLAMNDQCADKLQDFVLHEAQAVLAGLYCTGGKKGDVPKDISKGIELYKQAAESGNAEADLILAGLYCTDKYVKADLDRAISYCQKAAEANVKKAAHWLKQCQIEKAKNGDVGLALSLGKKLYEEGQKEAVELLEIAASKSDPVALRMLGEAYWRGELVPEDNKKAVSWLQKAAQKGSLLAAELLVAHYEEYEKDEVKLLKALEQAIALAASEKYVEKDEDFVLSDDLYDLAWLYCSGGEDGKIARNVPKGIELFEKAIGLGDTDSYLALAEIYSKEEYMVIDYDRAISYCRKAVEANVDDAEDVLQEISEERKKALKQEDLKILLDNYKNDSTGETSLALAQKYEEGEGIEKDEAKAVSFYQEAAKQGNAEAVYNLGRVAENGIDMDGDIAQALQLYELAGKLGYSPAFEALDQLQEQLATCCAEIISRTSGEQINFSIEKLEIKKAIAVCKHLALKSFGMAMLYYGYITMHDGQGDFSKKYRNSSDPLELTLAFLEVLEQTENNDDAWYFLEKLFSKNVYCAFLNFIVAIMVMLKESDDKEFVIKMHEYLSLFCGVCALGGCLEAQGLCIHLEIDIDDPVFRKRVEKEWETQRSEVIAKLKNVLKVHPTISVKQWILVNFPTISSKIFQ